MPHNRSPEDFDLITYLWVAIVAFWGGITHNIQKFRNRKDKNQAWTFSGFIGDIAISGFIGLMTFYTASYVGICGVMNAVLVGVMSHMGTKALSVFEEAVTARIKAIIGGAGDGTKDSK